MFRSNRIRTLASLASLVSLIACVTVDDATARSLAALEARVASLEAQQKLAEQSALQARELTGWLEERQKPYTREPVELPLEDSPILGSTRAPITAVVFVDLHCPLCARKHPELVRLLTDPELEGKLKVVYKHFPSPSEPLSLAASRMSLAATEQGEDQYWFFISTCFERNQELQSEEHLFRWAAELGLDMERLRKDLVENQAKYDETIQRDVALGRRLQIPGTPSIFIDGWYVGNKVSEIKHALLEKGILTPEPEATPADPAHVDAAEASTERRAAQQAGDGTGDEGTSNEGTSDDSKAGDGKTGDRKVDTRASEPSKAE